MTRNKLLSPREIIEYAIRVDQIGSVLNESLLLEELDQEVALKISQGNDELIAMLEELNRAFGGKIPSIDKEIKKLSSAADKSATVLSKLVKGSNSKLSSEKLMSKITSFFKGKFDPKATMNSILLLQSRAQELVEVLKFAMPKIVKQLDNAGAKKTDQKKMYEALGANQSMVEMALFDVLIKSQPGIFKSAGNFFKTLNVNKEILDINDKVDYKSIAKEMSEMKISDFFSIHEGTANIKTDGGSDLKDVIKKAGDDLKNSADKEAKDAGSETTSKKEPPPTEDPKEAKKEVEAATTQLKSAAKVAVKSPKPPAMAMGDALEKWSAGLSKSSQASLKAKNRLGSLKDIVGVALEDSAKAVEGEVKAAIQAWREENEAELMKSKRFAKKNFDALEKIIPQIASIMLKKKAEANRRLTKEMVHKSVFTYLDKVFASKNSLMEMKSQPRNLKKDSSMAAMVHIAKLLKEISEAGIKDARGKVVIEPGLKVRHKKSGLEYSVQDVEKNSDKIKIVLAVPEMPRVDTTKTFPGIVTEKDTVKKLDDLIDAADQHQETIFVVDEKEFEKDYEVK